MHHDDEAFLGARWREVSVHLVHLLIGDLSEEQTFRPRQIPFADTRPADVVARGKVMQLMVGAGTFED